MASRRPWPRAWPAGSPQSPRYARCALACARTHLTWCSLWQADTAGEALSLLPMMVPTVESSTAATKVEGLTALHHLVSVATGAELNWQREALATILLRALVFWEEDALCLSVPAAVRALTAIHALHGGASSASGAAALAACERLAAELIRALGMVESDRQRSIILAGLRELIGGTHLLMAQFLHVRTTTSFWFASCSM